VDFWALVFNPSTMHRLVHVWIGAFLVGTFFIMSISAFYLLRKKHEEFARRSFDGALMFATVAALAMLLSGHMQAENVYEHQPAKMAAFEGHFETGPAGLSLFGIPDAEAETIHLNISIPGGLGILLHGDPDAPVVGLDRFRPEDRPPVLLSFTSYHTMVGLGFAFIGLTLLATFLRWRGRLYRTRWLLVVFVPAVILPIAANELGWVAAEVGRQPWSVHPPVPWNADGTDMVTGDDGFAAYDEAAGLRTADSVSPGVDGGKVLASIIGFGLIYLALGAVWLIVLDKKIRQGPSEERPPPGEGGLLDAASGLAAHEDRLTGRESGEGDGEVAP
jgi:cytochrome d ubiquinol oxidase subunit I